MFIDHYICAIIIVVQQTTIVEQYLYDLVIKEHAKSRQRYQQIITSSCSSRSY